LQKDNSANASAMGFFKSPGNKYQHNAAHAAGYTEQYVLNAHAFAINIRQIKKRVARFLRGEQQRGCEPSRRQKGDRWKRAGPRQARACRQRPIAPFTIAIVHARSVPKAKANSSAAYSREFYLRQIFFGVPSPHLTA